MKLCLGLIATNEEVMLLRHLPKLSGYFEGEVVAVDYGSTDNTNKILTKYCKYVHKDIWPDDFGKAKTNLINLAERAGYDWMFLLDADEFITAKDLKIVKYCIENNDYESYCVARVHYYKEDIICAGSEEFPDPQARIFKLNCGYHYRSPRHCSLYKGNNTKSVWEIGEFAWIPIYIQHYRMLKPKKELIAAATKRSTMQGPVEKSGLETEARVPLKIKNGK